MKRERLNRLIQDWLKLDGREMLQSVLQNDANARVAVSSSFGAESAVLLSLVAEIDPATPIVTVDTGKLFNETLMYRDLLADHFGLSDVRVARGAQGLIDNMDPEGGLHLINPDLCCQVRKVMAHAQAVSNFDILITGRKQHHGGGRAALPTVNVEGQHIKVNPLATWREAQIEAAFIEQDLPRHPLVEQGYRSIGCESCTKRTESGENARSGRWVGHKKTECGLHTAANDTYQFELTEYGQ